MTGYIDCKFWMSDGLKYDIEDIMPLAIKGESFKTFQKKEDVGWSVDKYLIPSPETPFVTSYSEVSYTLWIRLMKTLLQFRESSTAWIKPAPLPFFQHHAKDWIGNFSEFDISRHLKFESDVKKTGQSCGNGEPTIDYRQCSSRYTSLYGSASDAFELYARFVFLFTCCILYSLGVRGSTSGTLLGTNCTPTLSSGRLAITC